MQNRDFVRYGLLLMGQPVAERLWVLLWQDFYAGGGRTDRNYGLLMGVTARHVSRAMDLLDTLGLIGRSGSTRSRRLLLRPIPTAVFCEGVVAGAYGTAVVDELRSGARVPEVSAASGPNDPVVNYAIQSVVGLYRGQEPCLPSYPPVSEQTGAGIVRLVQSVHPEGDDVSVVVTGSVVDPEAQVAYYATDDLAASADKRITTKRQRTAVARASEVPKNSYALMYWQFPRIESVDAENYSRVVGLIEYWNELFRNTEPMTKRAYCRVRYLLVDQQIPESSIRNAFKAAKLDKFWSEKATLESFTSDAGRIRKMGATTPHDRFASNTKTLITGDDFATAKFEYASMDEADVLEW